MNDLKCGDHVRGNIVRTSRTAEGIVLGIHERTVSIETSKGERAMLDKKTIENIGIGAKIKARRKELKMSQNELSDKVGVHFTSISVWETGKVVPARDNIEALEKSLGISLAGLSEKAFNGVTVSYDPSVIKKKEVAPLREKDILDAEGNFKQPVPEFKEPITVEEIKKIPVTIIESPPVIEILPIPKPPISKAEMDEIFPDTEPFITIQPLDLDEVLTAFFPRFSNFHADYQLAGAVELLLQAEAGNACLDDLRKARAKLDKAIACLEK